MSATGRIVLLNGAPRAGKSSIAAAMQGALPGRWINLGVDAQNRALPPALLPGIGLRPGGERPDLEPVVVALYDALWGAIAAHAEAGLDVVADVGIHDWYSRPLGILPLCAGRLRAYPALFVGVHCPIETIMARRDAGPDTALYLRSGAGNAVPEPVQRWQDAVHRNHDYDLTLDTAALTTEACVAAIGAALADTARPWALQRLAAHS